MTSRLTWVGLRCAAVLYTGGSVAQVLKLLFGFPWEKMPFWVDWAIVVLGTAGAVTLAIHTRRIAYRGAWEKLVHFLILVHLTMSVVLHLWVLLVRTHDVFKIFPLEYSYFALAYFLLFAWRSWTVRLTAVESL